MVVVGALDDEQALCRWWSDETKKFEHLGCYPFELLLVIESEEPTP
jgi:hypothetical protein